MVGSIDPRCEILRGTHWPVKVASVFGTRVAENHLGQRYNNRINRPDIWMQAIRSDLKKLLWHGGRPHMGPCFRRDDERGFDYQTANAPSRPRGAMRPSRAFIFRPLEGVGNAGCPLHPRPRVQL